MNLKEIIRKCLIKLHLDINKSLKYDRLTEKIINRCVDANSVCIDVGCHKGDILDLFLRNSPKKKHFAFEPLPELFQQLKAKYSHKCHVYDIALSDRTGTTEFNYVVNAPAFSGIKKRDYAIDNPQINIINVKLEKLDDIIPPNENINFIKVDVEGAEMSVFMGAENTISRCLPFVLFEFGKGASNYYNTSPKDIYDYFARKDMKISLCDDWLRQKSHLTLEAFSKHYEDNSEYYFLAHR